MKSFIIGIILFVILIVGGLITVSFMDVDVPSTQVSVPVPLPAESQPAS